METLLAALRRMTGKKRIDRPIPSKGMAATLGAGSLQDVSGPAGERLARETMPPACCPLAGGLQQQQQLAASLLTLLPAPATPACRRLPRQAGPCCAQLTGLLLEDDAKPSSLFQRNQARLAPAGRGSAGHARCHDPFSLRRCPGISATSPGPQTRSVQPK